MKKSGRAVENDFKALGPQLFTDYANRVKAVDRRGMAPVALQSAQRGG